MVGLYGLSVCVCVCSSVCSQLLCGTEVGSLAHGSCKHLTMKGSPGSLPGALVLLAKPL